MLRYLEPWHADVYDFIELRKNHGKEEQRARDLFLGLWIPDLFMKRVKQNEEGPAVGFLAAGMFLGWLAFLKCDFILSMK